MLEKIIKGMEKLHDYDKFIKELNNCKKDVYIYIYYDGVEGWSYSSYSIKSCEALNYDCCLGENDEYIAEYIYRYNYELKTFVLER